MNPIDSEQGGSGLHEYDFVSIAVQRYRDGASLSEDYRPVIRDRATRGWEFVQAISFADHAEPRIDLVFTRKVTK